MKARRTSVRVLAFLAMCATAVPGGPTAHAAKPKPPPAFVDGAWMGKAVGGGDISFGEATGFSVGNVKFTLVLSEGKVVEGRMDSAGYASSDVPGATAELTFIFEGEMSGEATSVRWEGTSGYEGEVTTEVLGTVPIGGSGPGYGEFKPATATCSKVTGDFAAYGRGLQKAAGAASNVQAKFIAVRDQSAEAELVLKEYTQLVGQIGSTLAAIQSGDASVEQITSVIGYVYDLQKHLNELKACGAAPPGFEQGLADADFSELLRQLIDAVLEDPNLLTTQQLLQLLYVGHQVGALGKTSPDKAAAQETLDTLLEILFDRVDTHAQEGDDAAILEIYLTAQQLGLKDLAAYAKEKLS